MHLASAAGVPTIGLFSSTRPEQYRPYGAQDEVIDVRTATPEQVAARVLARRKREDSRAASGVP
jgi:ADP-heptose:LPS heptosyltransferase